MIVVLEVTPGQEREGTPGHHIVGEIVAVGIVIREAGRGQEGDPFLAVEIHDRITDLRTNGQTLDARIHRHQLRRRFVENQENLRPLLLRQRHQLHPNRLHPMRLNHVAEAH